MWAGVIGVVILVAVGGWLARQLPGSIGAALRGARHSRLAVAAYATALASVFLVGFAVVGGVVLLVTAMVVAASAELLVLTQRS